MVRLAQRCAGQCRLRWRVLCRGCGLAVDDLDVWSHVADSASYAPTDRYVLFELQLSEVRCNGYGDVPMPSTRRWSVDQ